MIRAALLRMKQLLKRNRKQAALLNKTSYTAIERIKLPFMKME
jgi:hypothetical protein